MRVQAEPTEILLEIDGARCRVWNGVTEDGEQVFLFVTRLAVANDTRSALVEKLIETTPPLMKRRT